jgi:hypothetical protein
MRKIPLWVAFGARPEPLSQAAIFQVYVRTKGWLRDIAGRGLAAYPHPDRLGWLTKQSGFDRKRKSR